VDRVATRAVLLPKSKTVLVETPHILFPFSKVRVMSAPISRLTLSSSLYTGKGIRDNVVCLLSIQVRMVPRLYLDSSDI